MINGSTLLTISFVYVGALFLIAWAGDRFRARSASDGGRPLTYSLSVGIYCTSWTFFGSVGLATTTGFDFLPVYTGGVLCFAFCSPLILRIVRLAKSQNITSVSDFLAARYGKSQSVAAVATLICLVAAMPYIALQLKAVAFSVETVLGASAMSRLAVPADTALVTTLAMIAFTILFGTRHIDATEHQDGLVLAVAAESVIKLTAFLAVGIFVVYEFFGGIPELVSNLRTNEVMRGLIANSFNGSTWLTITLLSFCAILLLPRQFHMIVVENRSEREIEMARWLFPLYLILINIFVLPIAAAGLQKLPPGAFSPDMYVLVLPLSIQADTITTIAFIGGLSAATAMVIVESLALAIMVCNGLVAPLLLRRQLSSPSAGDDMARTLLLIRRLAIVLILLGGYAFYSLIGVEQALASIGLVSFAGIAQLAPAFFIGLVWRKGTARGAIAGMAAGIAVWVYTLVLPWLVRAGYVPISILQDGPFGIGLLAPQALFYLRFDPLTHGVIWSLFANIATFVTVSLLKPLEPVERIQANQFVLDDGPRPSVAPSFRLWRTSITVGDLQNTTARYLGLERAERAFKDYADSRNAVLDPTAEADVQYFRFAERLLASAIGAASARLVLTILLRRGNVGNTSAMRLLDDASEALQYNRDLLQSAIDQVRHGLSVFDKDLRLVCWNRQFRELLDLPQELGRVGVPLDRILRVIAERGDFGAGNIDDIVRDRVIKLAVRKDTFVEHFENGRRILEIRTSSMPQGGIVTTYADITRRMAVAEALERANETLERRVDERTQELVEANAALAAAKAAADAASLDKTRFLAAASHDILQPLNAARLYASSLVERFDNVRSDATSVEIASNIDASLDAVEEILGALIEIARLDTGRMDPEITTFPIGAVFERLAVEFGPLAKERGLDLVFVKSSAWVTSDRRLLPRLLQNFVSNAIKYTPAGRVLIGVRRKGNTIRIEVHDTGPGIAESKRDIVFKEFERLSDTAASTRGLGLGLSIVERIGRVLGHRVDLKSKVGRGSAFSVEVPRAPVGSMLKSEPRNGGDVHSRVSGLTVLCIDNDPSILQGMTTLLSAWGCHVIAADSAASAEQRLIETMQQPDIILADYHLDQGTGVEAIAAVRAAIGSEVPAIIITADNSAQLLRDVRVLGFGMLRKPVKAAALRAAITQISLKASAAAE